MMKRKLLAAWLTLVMLLALTACGGASAPSKNAMDDSKAEISVEESMDYAADMEYGGDIMYEEPGESAPTEDSAATGQKLIRTAWLTMETTSFDEAIQGLSALTEDFGGYFENSTVTNRKTGSRWAEYTVRVPADKYNVFLSQAGELCHLTRQEANQQDISEAYYDTAGRLKTQQIKLERLQALLAEATVMEDIITIESAISETEQAIDSLSGRLRHYDGKVDYATVYVNIQEVYKLSNVEEVPETFGERLGNAFGNGVSNFVDSMEDLAVSFAYSWIWWLIFAVIVVAAIRVVRRKVKLPKRKKKDDKPEEN